MKLLEDDVRENLGELAFGKDVLYKTPKAWSINLKIDKLNSIKVILTLLKFSDKRLIPNIYKVLLKFSSKKITNPIKKPRKDLNRHFTKEDIQIAKKHMKRCFISCH